MREMREMHDLTPRERDIVRLIWAGSRSHEIAFSLGISIKTVETHRANMLRKWRARNVVELCRLALGAGILERKR